MLQSNLDHSCCVHTNSNCIKFQFRVNYFELLLFTLPPGKTLVGGLERVKTDVGNGLQRATDGVTIGKQFT